MVKFRNIDPGKVEVKTLSSMRSVADEILLYRGHVMQTVIHSETSIESMIYKHKRMRTHFLTKR